MIRDIDLHQGPLDAIALSESDLILFVAGQNGVLLSLMLPIMAEIKHKEFNMHNKNITKVFKSDSLRFPNVYFNVNIFSDEYDNR